MLAIRFRFSAGVSVFFPRPTITFYFEDADLCLRYRQMGLEIALLDAPYEHERSSSSRLLPQFAVESVLNRNRARQFRKMGQVSSHSWLLSRSNRGSILGISIVSCSVPAYLLYSAYWLESMAQLCMEFWGVHSNCRQLFPSIRVSG